MNNQANKNNTLHDRKKPQVSKTGSGHGFTISKEAYNELMAYGEKMRNDMFRDLQAMIDRKS